MDEVTVEGMKVEVKDETKEDIRVENVLINLGLVQTKEDGKFYVTCSMNSIPPNKSALLSPVGLAMIIQTLINRIAETIPEDRREVYYQEYLKVLKHVDEYTTKIE